MDTNPIEDLTGGAAKKSDITVKLQPTLFIGVGGTGMEVLLRVRRHILNAVWGTGTDRVRVESLTDFPVAEFINFDLAVDDTIESGQSQKGDALHDLVKFTEEERIVESFEIDKYSRDDDSLGRYPHIQSWSPLTPKKIRDLGIDPSKGAGQIRGISRLYFFDKYIRTRDQIRLKLKGLQNGLSKADQLKRLGLEQAQEKFKIVVVCSAAGGTGSGSFIDMGWLAGWLGKELPSVDTELVLFMPSGFRSAGKDRTEANGYAALMELETVMRGGASKHYLTRWDAYENPTLNQKPYDEVYLVDSGNVAQQHTGDIKDVYQMVADALFENFASAEFANRKRAIAVNQRQHKITPLSPPVNGTRFGDMKLQYHKGYSAFGQAMLDTQQSSQRDMRAHVWAGEMLKAFFGVGSGDLKANRATDKQRDTFMSERMLLSRLTFSDFPEFSSRNVELKRSSGEFSDFLVVEELLKGKSGNLVADVQQKVDDRIEAIKAGFKRDEWVPQVRDLVKQLERDSIRDQDATADVVEDRIAQHRKILIAQIKTQIEDQLYTYLDNQEFGGIEYVLTLVEQIKDQLANASTGLISQLTLNAARYQEIKDAVRTQEYERLMGNLAQAKGGLFSSGEKQSIVIMDQLKTEITNFLKFHLRTKAANEAVGLMTDLSKWLGEKTGVDNQGRPIWNGLVGEFQRGREAVMEMIGTLQQSVANLKQDLKKDHATYIYIKADEPDIPLPAPALLREWADESFKDIGGSRVLFMMLRESDDRAALLSKVKHMAERQIAVRAGGPTERDATDPLFEALDQMTPTERIRRFKELLARAMPWIDAKFGDSEIAADQYKCFIGVANATQFEKRFRDEINAAVPGQAKITSGQVSIVDTGVSGRAVCYCELSGVPLTVLRGLEAWRTSYRKESEKIPVHAHIDSTQFEHPIVPSPDELNRLADDFKQFLLAVMLGVLERSPKKVVPPGQYQFAVRPGERFQIGNERSFRKSGLPQTRREQIISRVSDKLDDLGKFQMAALAALAGLYSNHVYKPKKVEQGETGEETEYQGFAYTMARETEGELKDRAMRKGLSERDFVSLEVKALGRLPGWAISIEGSEKDAYEWEVAPPDDESGPRLKYLVRKELFEEGADDQLAEVLGLRTSQATPLQSSAHGAVGAAPPLPGAAPSLHFPSAPVAEYMLAINGQQAGPYTKLHVQHYLAAGQITHETLLWKAGMSGWLPISQIPEFALPPPLPTAAPPLPSAAPALPGNGL